MLKPGIGSVADDNRDVDVMRQKLTDACNRVTPFATTFCSSSLSASSPERSIVLWTLFAILLRIEPYLAPCIVAFSAMTGAS